MLIYSSPCLLTFSWFVHFENITQQLSEETRAVSSAQEHAEYFTIHKHIELRLDFPTLFKWYKVNWVDTVQSHERHKTWISNHTGRGPPSYEAETACPDHFLFSASCGFWSGLLPVLLAYQFWQHYLRALLTTCWAKTLWREERGKGLGLDLKMSSLMDGEVLSLSSSPSPSLSGGSQNDVSTKSDGNLPTTQQEKMSTKELWPGYRMSFSSTQQPHNLF